MSQSRSFNAIESLSEEDKILFQPWDRKQTELFLQKQPSGCIVIRPSSLSAAHVAASVKTEEEGCQHYLFYLDEKGLNVFSDNTFKVMSLSITQTLKNYFAKKPHVSNDNTAYIKA